ncbi:hypothetical protein Tco_0006702, partial [Tanacetum coccineum]
MTSKDQQIALDNALVAPENQRGIGKCNMRINPRMKPKESTYQVVLDALALTTCYPAFLITAEVSIIYMHQFWATVNKHKASYRFKIDNKKFSVNVEVFREILNICPKIPGQEFDEPPSEEETLSFIRELGHSREIKYITDVIVDHLHQPWRTFASIINKCLSGKKAPIKADRGKGLNVLSEVALSEAAQLKEISGTNEGTGAKLEVPDVPKYDSESDKESWGDSGEEDDTKDDEGNDDGDDSDGNDDDDDNDGNDDDDSDHKRIESDRDENPNLNQFNEEHEEEEEKENVDEFTDKEDDVNNANEENKEESNDGEELYKYVNVNLRKEDVEMTDADQGRADQHNVSQESGFEQEEEDAHVTLTIVHETQKTEGPMQSSSVSSDFTEKLLNFENISLADNEISSLMDTMVRHEEPSGQTSTFFTVPITVRTIIREEVKSQLPHILPKAVSDFATLVIE